MSHKLSPSLLYKSVLWLVVILALGAVVLGALNVMALLNEQKVAVLLGNGTFKTTLADTDEKRTEGLAGVSSLEPSEGMLFVFPENDTWTIWMKGMTMPIDIIWLDDNKRVIHAETNVQPDAPPYVKYAPEKPARYVVELPAGSIRKHGIKMKEVAVFQLPEKVR